MTSTTSPVRVSVSVSPEVYETYKRLAEAGSMSMSRAMGEWLGDTIEAAQFMAEKMEQARAAPKMVMREMHAYALGLADETGDLLNRVRAEGSKARRAAAGSASAGPADVRRDPVPPSCNTGGKVPKPKGTGSKS
jgi:hypothetical protein